MTPPTPRPRPHSPPPHPPHHLPPPPPIRTPTHIKQPPHPPPHPPPTHPTPPHPTPHPTTPPHHQPTPPLRRGRAQGPSVPGPRAGAAAAHLRGLTARRGAGRAGRVARAAISSATACMSSCTAPVGLVTPVILRTNWSAAASISSSVAGGSEAAELGGVPAHGGRCSRGRWCVHRIDCDCARNSSLQLGWARKETAPGRPGGVRAPGACGGVRPVGQPAMT